MKKGNLFRSVYARIYDYFTAKLVRKVFFFSLCAVVLFLLIIQFAATKLIMGLLIASAAVCAVATLVDSIQARSFFLNEISLLEYNYFARLVERHGEETAMQQGGAFSPEEIAYIKKTKRDFNYTIAVKLILILILIVFFFYTV